MIPLSPATIARLQRLFHAQDQERARSLLERECADNLPFCESSDMFTLERLRFAVLKLSGGEPGRLRSEIEAAKIDWRDTLMAAGFGHDVSAHKQWTP
jgi:hypothetical protein